MPVEVAFVAKDGNMHFPYFADDKIIEAQNEGYVAYTTILRI
jgi:hypothetical protein